MNWRDRIAAMKAHLQALLDDGDAADPACWLYVSDIEMDLAGLERAIEEHKRMKGES